MNFKVGPHRDDSELIETKPIVSISLGCSAIFLIESKPFQSTEVSKPIPVLLNSGDVIIKKTSQD